MNRKIKLSKFLKMTGILFLALAVAFFCLSFNVKRDIQEVFGFSSIAFIPIGAFCFCIGQLFQTDRSRRNVLGMIFLSAGVTLLLLGMLLAFGIIITVFGFGIKPIWLYADRAFFFFGIAFVSVGIVLTSAKSKPR